MLKWMKIWLSSQNCNARCCVVTLNYQACNCNTKLAFSLLVCSCHFDHHTQSQNPSLQCASMARYSVTSSNLHFVPPGFLCAPPRAAATTGPTACPSLSNLLLLLLEYLSTYKLYKSKTYFFLGSKKKIQFARVFFHKSSQAYVQFNSGRQILQMTSTHTRSSMPQPKHSKFLQSLVL